MPNQYKNKVIYNNQTLIDLTSDTATAADVAQGKTFHLASGEPATGTASGGGGTGVWTLLGHSDDYYGPEFTGSVYIYINNAHDTLYITGQLEGTSSSAGACGIDVSDIIGGYYTLPVSYNEQGIRGVLCPVYEDGNSQIVATVEIITTESSAEVFLHDVYVSSFWSMFDAIIPILEQE